MLDHAHQLGAVSCVSVAPVQDLREAARIHDFDRMRSIVEAWLERQPEIRVVAVPFARIPTLTRKADWKDSIHSILAVLRDARPAGFSEDQLPIWVLSSGNHRYFPSKYTDDRKRSKVFEVPHPGHAELEVRDLDRAGRVILVSIPDGTQCGHYVEFGCVTVPGWSSSEAAVRTAVQITELMNRFPEDSVPNWRARFLSR